MTLKHFSKRVVIAGTLLIWCVKYLIRPYYTFSHHVSFIFGIAPNFLGSFLIPFGACWFFQGRDNRLARYFQVRTAQEVRNVCILGFVLLVINEYLQKIRVFGRTFDYFDIIFSVFGLILACFVFSRKLEKQYSFTA
ncbi:MAG: hypothetical protein U0U70_00135 [Chitinophagaceae bacterium]